MSDKYDSEKEILAAVRKIARDNIETTKGNHQEFDLADSADILSKNIDDTERAVEAILFASDKPLKASEIGEIIGVGIDVANVHIGNILAKLKRHYTGRGIMLAEVAGGWRFQTSPDLALLLKYHKDEPKKLSNAALETLAIIAYHQPCTRAEIEEIRGVSVGKGTLDQLMEMKWIKYGARRRTAGKPLTYRTTENFLSHFNLSNLDDLPNKLELQAQGLLSANLPKDFEIPRPSNVVRDDEQDFVDGEITDTSIFANDFFDE